MNFQEVIMRLNRFWADQGCVIWQPHNVQVGAGTANPATVLRVLGPEPWNVAYLEPSVRPGDGRYGENPNRWQEYYQYQVILKPDTGNHIDVYLRSLEALGINWRQHDIRLVEDNWQSPSLGAWGLGWEVWLDGLEITQYTYFQQACGIDLDPVCVEITYGLERIVMYLQGVERIQDILWLGDLRYGDLHLDDEVAYCRYNFDTADVGRLRQMYDLYEAEAILALEQGLVLPAHDNVLKCSHLFNQMDARRAVSVTQRADYFARMRDLARRVAQIHLQQREQNGYVLSRRKTSTIVRALPTRESPLIGEATAPADFVLEIGVEELPPADLSAALSQLRERVPETLAKYRLKHGRVRVNGTPRRLVIYIDDLAARQSDEDRVIKGPRLEAALDTHGRPTSAALGFAHAHDVPVESLITVAGANKTHVAVRRIETGKPAATVLSQAVPELMASLEFQKTMRWNETGIAFPRPIRWILALHSAYLVDIEYAGVASDRFTYGLRPEGSPKIPVQRAGQYAGILADCGVMLDTQARRRFVWERAKSLAGEVGGMPGADEDLLDEVTQLVERPEPLLGSFETKYLQLPEEVIVTVMRQHQRYFSVHDSNGVLLPYFITVANGSHFDATAVRHGNEAVLRARFADAEFFHANDLAKPLNEYVPLLAGLTFQRDLGSYLEKVRRICQLVPVLGALAGASGDELEIAQRAAYLCKADLATQMVIEHTALQGLIGRVYAMTGGEEPRVAEAIAEHYQPRFNGDNPPRSRAGLLVGLADRLDSLVGLFAVGLAPTSTADPYGLRRAASGIIQALAAQHCHLSLNQAVQAAAQLQAVNAGAALRQEVVTFIQRRLQAWLVEGGHRPDLVDAVMSESADDPAYVAEAVAELLDWLRRPEFPALRTAFERAANIVRDAEGLLPFDVADLCEQADQELYEAYMKSSRQIGETRAVEHVLGVMLPLATAINTFFSDVMVMHENTRIRNARLALLQRVAALPKGVVNLGRIR